MWLEWLNTINWNGLVSPGERGGRRGGRGGGDWGCSWTASSSPSEQSTPTVQDFPCLHWCAFSFAFSHSQLVWRQIKCSWECWCRPAAWDPLGIGRNHELGLGLSCAAWKQPCTQGRGPGGSARERGVIWGYLKWSIKPLNFNQGCYYTDRHDLLPNQDDGDGRGWIRSEFAYLIFGRRSGGVPAL